MNGRLVSRDALDPSLAQAMYALLYRHFAGIDPAGFVADLEDKDQVLLLEDEGRLVGFTTLALAREPVAGEQSTVVYSGDTIVEPEAWGSPELPRTWIRSVRSLHEEAGGGPLWWLLIVSGFRTYRFLPVFCRRFHAGPTEGVAADEDSLPAIAASLARRRFGDAWDPRTGIVRLPRPQRLREPLRELPAGRLRNRHVARFLALNAGHTQGDELVCLAKLGDENLTRAGLRMLYGPRSGRVSRRGEVTRDASSP